MSMLSRLFMVLGALLAAAWVALSAASSHIPALQSAGPALAASLAQHQFHALGLLLLGLLMRVRASRWLLASGGLMLLGFLLFCLNIDARLLSGWDGARALVPWGGMAFILSWLCLLVGVLGDRWDSSCGNQPH